MAAQLEVWNAQINLQGCSDAPRTRAQRIQEFAMSIFLSNPLVSRRIVRHGSCQLRADSSAADEGFPSLTKRLQAEKPKFAERQQALLAKRYDHADRRGQGNG